MDDNYHGKEDDIVPTPHAETLHTKNHSKSWLKLLVLLLLLLLIAASGVIAWKLVKGNSNDNPTQKTTAYLSNSNEVVCTADSPEIRCEDLVTGKLQNYIIPKKYQDAIIISASPDGTRLLIQLSNKDVVVTNTSFEEVRKIFDGTEGAERYPSFIWADKSSNILITEIRREQNDAEFLPEPLVVQMYNVDTGKDRRVYKTGEKVDVESIRVIGSNDTYLFIKYQTPKNWVAEDVRPPAATMNAIRLSDGYVLPINSHQVSVDTTYYDVTKDVFLSIGYKDGDSEKSQVTASTLEDGEFGLVLRKKFGLDTSLVDSTSNPALTLKGIQVSNISTSPAPFQLVQDNGTITKINLNAKDAYSTLLSLKTMPNLPK